MSEQVIEIKEAQENQEAPQTQEKRKGSIGKAIAIVVACFVILAIAVSYAGFVVTPKDNGEDDGVIKNRARSILAEPENSLDVVFVGNSLVSYSVDPFQIYEKYGITSYNAAYGSMRSYSGLSWLYNVVYAKQTPKVVVFDADVLYNQNQPMYALIQMMEDVVPLSEYHHRWKELKLDDFYKPVNYTHYQKLKGYGIHGGTSVTDLTGYMTRGGDWAGCGPVSELCLWAMKQLCDQMGSEFVVVMVPSVTMGTIGKHNTIQALSEKYGFTFIDMNMDDSVGIDWSQDSYDSGTHMNWVGAAKVTDSLADTLHEMFPELEDHRGDPAYADAWENQLPRYHEIMDNAKAGIIEEE